jgi:hypothetical protein
MTQGNNRPEFLSLHVSTDYLDEHRRRQPRPAPVAELIIQINKTRATTVELDAVDLVRLIVEAGAALQRLLKH